ncbi:MAG: multiheme c-type cytochrome [bacterium]
MARHLFVTALGLALGASWVVITGTAAYPAPPTRPTPRVSPTAAPPARADGVEPPPVADHESGCTTARCHQSIEPIRQGESGMAKAILRLGRKNGDPAGCVVCHGGAPRATNKRLAHGGAPAALTAAGGPKEFYPDPGSPWINRHSCGQCHAKHVATQSNSLMMTEAGKIQGAVWAFGALTGYEHTWANYDARNPDRPEMRSGTAAYRSYMRKLRTLDPPVFPDKHIQVPGVPTDLSRLQKEPQLAAFTYIRSECQRCHLAVRGRQTRGDYRGMGCSACHIPYGNEGRYEGQDKSIPKDKAGHLLVHSIQSSRKVKVTVNGVTYSGIPVETCTTCHDRGKRIGVTFQGLMESAYTSPYTAGGKGQPKLHTKRYLAMHEDVHSTKGMLCMDCHTSSDVHGDGFLAGTTLAQVEIECTDCHGTPSRYPWELPLGVGEELGGSNRRQEARGVATKLRGRITQATRYDREGGYLLSARGNPLRNVVRRGSKVVVHTAGGKDLVIEPLKTLKQSGELSVAGRVAMVGVEKHLDRVECYACHGMWTPQCYGCHARIDYSRSKRSFDWVAAGHRHRDAARRRDRGETGYDTYVPGRVTEQRSYMRWAEPILVVNGEGRVSPAAPGCQVSVTVIGPDGKTLLENHIFRTVGGTEGSGARGQLSLDMSPTQPHSTGRARSCESCHTSPKALGYGIGGGRLNRRPDRPVVVDLMTADRRILPRTARTQIAAIPGLETDWSRIVTEDGKQLMTVGHHWSRSRPLNNAERANMSRQGICLACHREIPKESLAVSLLHHVAKATGQLPKNRKDHHALVRQVLLTSAWAQLLGALLVALLALGGSGVGVRWYLRRRRARRSTDTTRDKSPPDSGEDAGHSTQSSPADPG